MHKRYITSKSKKKMNTTLLTEFSIDFIKLNISSVNYKIHSFVELWGIENVGRVNEEPMTKSLQKERSQM